MVHFILLSTSFELKVKVRFSNFLLRFSDLRGKHVDESRNSHLERKEENYLLSCNIDYFRSHKSRTEDRCEQMFGHTKIVAIYPLFEGVFKEFFRIRREKRMCARAIFTVVDIVEHTLEVCLAWAVRNEYVKSTLVAAIGGGDVSHPGHLDHDGPDHVPGGII